MPVVTSMSKRAQQKYVQERDQAKKQKTSSTFPIFVCTNRSKVVYVNTQTTASDILNNLSDPQPKHAYLVYNGKRLDPQQTMHPQIQASTSAGTTPSLPNRFTSMTMYGIKPACGMCIRRDKNRATTMEIKIIHLGIIKWEEPVAITNQITVNEACSFRKGSTIAQTGRFLQDWEG